MGVEGAKALPARDHGGSTSPSLMGPGAVLLPHLAMACPAPGSSAPGLPLFQFSKLVPQTWAHVRSDSRPPGTSCLGPFLPSHVWEGASIHDFCTLPPNPALDSRTLPPPPLRSWPLTCSNCLLLRGPGGAAELTVPLSAPGPELPRS